MPGDLAQERETFVRTFLRKGVELTEELLRENGDLRDENQRLHRENTRLRTQVASDDAIRDLLKTIEALEEEKRQLLERSTRLERTQESDEGRYEEIEHELHDLANLYVASFQLHASLSPRRVVRHLQDMLGQLVGADGFAIYLVDAEGREAVPIAWENLTEAPVSVPVGEGAVGDACLTGLAQVASSLEEGSLVAPLAVVPMLVEGRAVGAIAITRMLEQKTRWAPLDQELFKLIGAHAGTALIAANLYSGEMGPMPALAGFVDNLKKRGASMMPPPNGE